MSDGTPEQPRRGGRPRIHENDKARYDAWAAKKKAERDGVAPPPADEVTVEVAPSALALVLEQIQEANARHTAFMADAADRFENAVAALGDPDAVMSVLDAGRTASQEAVAAAEARAAVADERRAQLEHKAREAVESAEVAEGAALEMEHRLEEAEAELAQARVELTAQQEARANAAAAYEADLAGRDEALAQLQTAHAEELEHLKANHDETVRGLVDGWAGERDELDAARRLELDRAEAAYLEKLEAIGEAFGAEVARADAARVRAEDELGRVRAELGEVRDEQPRLVEAARDNLRAALEAQHAADLAAAEARGEAGAERLRGQLDACKSRLEAAEERIQGLTTPDGV